MRSCGIPRLRSSFSGAYRRRVVLPRLLRRAGALAGPVLEIGCGDGRVTWSYVGKAARVTAIDPAANQIALAREQLPRQLQDRVEFHSLAFEDFAAARAPSTFHVVLLSSSLC